MATAISADVLDLLQSGVECDGPALRITQQIDRKLYEAANKVLTALGGKWTRAKKAHIFAEDAAPLIADVVATGQYVNERKENEFFPTPPAVVAEMERHFIEAEHGLEPSAGDGNIAVTLRWWCKNLLCIEKSEKRAADCDKRLDGDADVVVGDFLERPPAERFGLIAMNPPFSRGQDMAHVQHAFRFLALGGRLVAIMSPGFTFRSDRKAVEFREWAEGLGASWEDLPEGSFKESGTGVRTVLFVVDAPAEG